MNGWGGARQGAGRPIQGDQPTKMRSLRATDKDWKLILEFARILKHTNRQAAIDFINQHKLS